MNRSRHVRNPSPAPLPSGARWAFLLFGLALHVLHEEHCAAAQPEVVPPPRFRYMGAASCTSVNCHGRDAFRGLRGSEHSVWIGQDAHAGSFSLLYEKASLSIYRKLRNSGRYAGLQPPHREQLCLSCHTLYAAPHELAFDHQFDPHDGVACEACHGPAESWIASHVAWDWRSRSAAEKARLGFVDTDDLLARARTCAQCHVGSPGREVNHDLIAAGHPPLLFEVAAYQAIMPRHWIGQDDALKLWAVGQFASAEAAVELLEYRAREGNGRAIWPELSEFSCFSCHHDLQTDSWRQKGYLARKPGLKPAPGIPAWGTWYFPGVKLLAQEFFDTDLQQEESPLGRLRNQALNELVPRRENVRREAAALRRQLREWSQRLNARSFGPEDSRTILKMLSHQGIDLAERDWEAAAQVHLGLVPSYQSYVAALRARGNFEQRRHAQVLGSLTRLRDALQYSSPFDGPARFSKDSPQATARARDSIREQLRALSRLIEDGLPWELPPPAR